jgi:putative DNA methylase
MNGNGLHMTPKKKLIEVALPLVPINAASAHEKQPGIGAHPRGLHLWWARRPLAAARAVIFAQMVDDPSSHPERFPSEKLQEEERNRLFRLIEELVLWENTTNERVLTQAREEIWNSWRITCADNKNHPRARDLFDPKKLPAFHDPFAGGGALPLEAQRLGLESYASDLNPVAVLINKAMIEIPPKFAGCPPVNPATRKDKGLIERKWCGAQGLAEDVRYYGQWMRDEAEKRIGDLYPKIEVTADMAKERSDLKPYIGEKLTVIAWLWARTVKSSNPAFAHVDVPLASTFMLSTKTGKEAYVEPVIEGGSYRFTVKVGKPKNGDAAEKGTKLSRGSFRCLFSGVPIPYEYIDDEANAGRMGVRLMAIVAEGDRRRVYLPPTETMEAVARDAKPTWKPDAPSRGTWASNAQGRRYGFQTFGDYFTPRELVALCSSSLRAISRIIGYRSSKRTLTVRALYHFGSTGRCLILESTRPADAWLEPFTWALRLRLPLPIGESRTGA